MAYLNVARKFPAQELKSQGMPINVNRQRQALMEKLKEEIEELQEKQKTEVGKKLKCTIDRLVEKRASLKKQEEKLKKMKGRPVALKKFLEEVVLSDCVLCPP